MHYRAYPECRPKDADAASPVPNAAAAPGAATTPETCTGHGWTFWESIRRNPIIMLVPGLSALAAAFYIYRGNMGFTTWLLMVLTPVLFCVLWYRIIRGKLCPVVTLYSYNGLPLIWWQWWPKNIAEELPDEARFVLENKPVYSLDRWDAPDSTEVIPFMPIDVESIGKPEIAVGFTQLADVQTVNTNQKSAFRRQVVKQGMLIGMALGLGLGSYVLAEKILTG